MDIRLSEREAGLQALLREILARQYPSPAAREAEHPLGAGTGVSADKGFARHTWTALARFGCLRLTLPTEIDGFGLGTLATVLAAEEMGRVLYRSPYLDTLAAADLIVGAGSSSAWWPLLTRIGEGDCTVALVSRTAPAVGEMAGRRTNPGLRVEETETEQVVDGEVPCVPFARQVDYLLLCTCLPGGGCGVYLLSHDRPGISLRRRDDMSRGELYGVRLDGVSLVSHDILRADVGADSAFMAVLTQTRVRQAAYLVGICQGALDVTTTYAKERMQFGRRLASFQALTFRMAALAARIEAARWFTYSLASRTGAGEDVRRHAAEALALAGDLAREVTAAGIQIHGSAGFLETAEAQRYYRHAAIEAVLYGSPAQLRAEAAALLAT